MSLVWPKAHSHWATIYICNEAPEMLTGARNQFLHIDHLNLQQTVNAAEDIDTSRCSNVFQNFMYLPCLCSVLSLNLDPVLVISPMYGSCLNSFLKTPVDISKH